VGHCREAVAGQGGHVEVGGERSGLVRLALLSGRFVGWLAPAERAADSGVKVS
jgi:hypothetical protein